MEMNKLFVAMMAASAMALTACGGDDDNDNNDGGSSATTCASGVGEVASESYFLAGATTSTPICDLSGTISQNVTLTSDYVYRLNGYVYVGNGNAQLTSAAGAANYTLTVEEGVQFRSSGLGSLIITRGSDIVVEGTAAKPVVMSSFDQSATLEANADVFNQAGKWGGLVIQGFGKNNQCEVENTAGTMCNTSDEAGTGYHGGADDADSSGSIQYLIVAEGGYEVAADSEVNGITVHSVGYGTTMENVMVYKNADDGIEFFGGAVNVKNLILVDNEDESVDWDDGYRGNLQFVLVRQGVSAAGDNGIEADNAGLSNTAEPVSNPTLANATFQVGGKGSAFFMRAKVGTHGTLVNVAAANYADAFRIENTETLVTLENVLVEFADETLRLGSSATEANISGWSSTSTSSSIELGSAFEVTGSEGVLSAAVTPESANGSTGFFTATSYIGAVEPTVTAAENAWWYWANAVVPAAFE